MARFLYGDGTEGLDLFDRKRVTRTVRRAVTPPDHSVTCVCRGWNELRYIDDNEEIQSLACDGTGNNFRALIRKTAAEWTRRKDKIKNPRRPGIEKAPDRWFKGKIGECVFGLQVGKPLDLCYRTTDLGYDFLINGQRVEVKAIRSDGKWLLVPPDEIHNADVFVLARFHVDWASLVGWIHHDQLAAVKPEDKCTDIVNHFWYADHLPKMQELWEWLL